MKKTLLLLTIILSFSVNAQDNIRASIDPLLYPFYHGVASGDPLSDRVILWTRVTDDTLTVDSVQVDWRIATDTSMNNIVNSGSGYAKASKDWTFKVDATGLQPNTWYYYDFNGLGWSSLRGRTKTAPVGDIDSVRFAIVSCSNWEHGYFHAYKHLKDRNDFDCVLHLGDYIYEYETGGFSANIAERVNEPTHEIITLEDYRLRYSHYRLDSDLRDLHQQFPFINIWDDHETANDSYIDGADNHDPGTEGSWVDRKAGATQAYHEWLPIRSPNATNTQIYRKFAWGDLIDLHMLDTRLEARVVQNSSAADDPNRPLLGTTQFDWLTNNLQTSTARWNILKETSYLIL
jgi:alkaline phosphatase D